MQRKKFISAAFLAVGSLKAMSEGFSTTNMEEPNKTKILPNLKIGDTIAICSPAGFITLADCMVAIKMMEAWGFKIKVGSSIGKKDFTFGGTDEERTADFQLMLDDTSIKAIMCARGGYGILRIIDKLNFSNFVKIPKWIIGFSDATVLHIHINKNWGIPTIHSKMCNSFVDPAIAEPIQLETLDSIRKCLMGEKLIYKIAINPNNKNGIAKGILIGGNLKTIESLAASKSDINTKNKILFVEDTGEYLYSIDRMFFNLKRSGKLSQLAALIVGGFKLKKDDEGEIFGKTLEQIVLEKVSEYRYPVCFDFPVGHQKNNFSLKCGVVHSLFVNQEKVLLEEL